MSLICPSCRRNLPAAETSTNKSIVTCAACGSRFLCTDGTLKDRMPAPPSGYRIDQDGADLVIVRTWFRWVYFLLPAFSIVWSVAFYLRAEGNHLMLIHPVGFGFGGIVLYLGIAALCNKTIIRITRSSLSVRQGPVPWPGSTRVPVERIEQICCRRRETGTREERKTPPADYLYDVVAILRDGKCVELITDLCEANEASFLEKTIEIYLGIDDVRIADGARDLVDMDSERRQRFWGRTIAISVIILGLALAALENWDIISHPEDDRAFDATVWQAQRIHTWHNPRRQMIDDLCMRHLYRGMTTDEAIALLGKPDLKPMEGHEHSEIRYSLGQWSLFFREDEMSIRFDSSGRVTGCYIGKYNLLEPKH